ncbi:M18 family aminopeptidase [uncultured Selenomonas sp.]|uniref:M18 family aminopeptidase n=1 Tax=uncultured Selenomonas sp. TaxID=159275 RepID=UPI0028DB2E68|nr:M18 family aminopeptidase [uncultured Selenomonas sp.]
MTSEEKSCAEDLIEFIDAATSPYQVVAQSTNLLRVIPMNEKTALSAGHVYSFSLYNTGIIFVAIGENAAKGPLRIACAHTDFPCLRVKSNPVLSVHGYGKLNVEVYGGMIRNTWMDRPLSLAGAVALRGVDPFAPTLRLVDFRRPLMIVPNLAIHMNRKVNEGVELKPQKDLLPLFFQNGDGDEDDTKKLLVLLAEELGVSAEDILSYDLNAYPYECGCLLGCDDAFLSAPRLDNLSSVKACMDAIREWNGEGIRVVALFDNEEVGSRTKQGAGSTALAILLERVCYKLGLDREEYLRKAMEGFCLSVDVAHALHPNAPEKADPTNQPVLSGGTVLKVAANQSYAGDPQAFAVVAGLCEGAGIPYQVFTNHSDAAGGATFGSILSTQIPMRTMDIGAPILGMHSARETMGARDQFALTQLLMSFFSA